MASKLTKQKEIWELNKNNFTAMVKLKNGLTARVDNKIHARLSDIANQVQDLIENDGIENIQTNKVIPLSLFTNSLFDIEFIKCSTEENGLILRVC